MSRTSKQMQKKRMKKRERERKKEGECLMREREKGEDK